MKRVWIYLSNTFETNTRKAFLKMLKIANDHLSRLNGDKGDADILAMWTAFSPLVILYQNLYSTWEAAVNFRASQTFILLETFKSLSKPWIRDWMNKTQAIFPEDSPQDKALYPQRKALFQVGSYEGRIIAVNSLATMMGKFPELKKIKADVEAKYQELLDARDAQKQAMQAEEKADGELEAQRLLLVEELFGNLGLLMHKYRKNPTLAERFFDLRLLRRSSTNADTTFSQEGMVDGATSIVVAIPKKFELGINASFVVNNSGGGGELHIFFAESAAATDSPNKAIVLPGESVEAKAGELGWNTGKAILIIRNVGEITAEYSLTAMEAVG